LIGPTLIGHQQFAGYVDWVTSALGQYTTDIHGRFCRLKG
jgi:hypothetical protein